MEDIIESFRKGTPDTVGSIINSLIPCNNTRLNILKKVFIQLSSENRLADILMSDKIDIDSIEKSVQIVDLIITSGLDNGSGKKISRKLMGYTPYIYFLKLASHYNDHDLIYEILDKYLGSLWLSFDTGYHEYLQKQYGVDIETISQGIKILASSDNRKHKKLFQIYTAEKTDLLTGDEYITKLNDLFLESKRVELDSCPPTKNEYFDEDKLDHLIECLKKIDILIVATEINNLFPYEEGIHDNAMYYLFKKLSSSGLLLKLLMTGKIKADTAKKAEHLAQLINSANNMRDFSPSDNEKIIEVVFETEKPFVSVFWLMKQFSVFPNIGKRIDIYLTDPDKWGGHIETLCGLLEFVDLLKKTLPSDIERITKILNDISSINISSNKICQ
jgi:hypothetical protein